jgi:hypothetical protein
MWRRVALLQNDVKESVASIFRAEEIARARSFLNVPVQIAKHIERLYCFITNTCGRESSSSLLHLQSAQHHGGDIHAECCDSRSTPLLTIWISYYDAQIIIHPELDIHNRSLLKVSQLLGWRVQQTLSL